MATTIGDLTEPLRELVRGFLEVHPEAHACDVYRLIYDGTCGATDSGSEDAQLRELSRLAEGASPEGAVVETTSVDGILVRVNVGPYLASGGELELLAAAAAQTAREHRPRRDLLFTLWAGFVHMNRRHEFRLDRRDVEHFEMTVATSGYPCVNHSEDYVRLYDPRYVLVRREFLPPASDGATSGGVTGG